MSIEDWARAEAERSYRTDGDLTVRATERALNNQSAFTAGVARLYNRLQSPEAIEAGLWAWVISALHDEPTPENVTRVLDVNRPRMVAAMTAALLEAITREAS